MMPKKDFANSMTKPDSSRPKKSFVQSFLRVQQMDARRSMMEELFNDMYRDRQQIYLMNFVRGIFFGLGSVLGGTVVVALIVWIMSFFVHIPWIGDTVQNTQQKIENSQRR